MLIFSFGLLSEAEGREEGSWQSAKGEGMELESSVTKKRYFLSMIAYLRICQSWKESLAAQHNKICLLMNLSCD